MRLIVRLLGIVLLTAIAVAVVAGVWIQDANRLKPELEALLSENSGYAVAIGGDISWQLFPPLILHIEDLTARNDERTIEASAIDLQMDLSAMWEDIERWQVSQLTLTDTRIDDAESTTVLRSLTLQDFQPGTPAPLTLDASYTAAASEDAVDAETPTPLNVTLDGLVTYHPATADTRERIALAETLITSDLGDGTCEADVTTAEAPGAAPEPAGDDDILPIATLHEYDFSGTCALTRLVAGTETFTDASLEFSNVAGQLDTLLEVRDFLDGTARADVSINTRQEPIVWTVLPEIANVDSQRLLDWSEQRLQWIAHIGANSSLTLQGNTPSELAASIRGTSEFDGGQGQLNIEKIKTQLASIAQLTRQSDSVASWPDLWEYEHFTGRWVIDGAKQQLAFALDNMSVDAEGEYSYLDDTLDLLGNVTIHEPAEGETSPFEINPLLAGTPIPIRCQGPSADPTCRLDQDATRNLVARALQRNDDSGLRRKLEDKIDEEVPEEYRETARDLLDLLGRSLERD